MANEFGIIQKVGQNEKLYNRIQFIVCSENKTLEEMRKFFHRIIQNMSCFSKSGLCQRNKHVKLENMKLELLFTFRLIFSQNKKEENI